MPHNSTVSAEHAGLRVDQLLVALSLFQSRNSAVQAVEQGRVLIDGCPISKNFKVKTGNVLLVSDGESDDYNPLAPLDLPFKIYFEDEHLLVLSKPSGLSVHPTDTSREPTLVNALLSHCGPQNLYQNPEDPLRPGIVHRLDKETSGLMLAAKSSVAAQKLLQDLKEHTINRHYLALVHGIFEQDTGLIDAPIVRSREDRKKMCIQDRDNSRDALTGFTVLKRFSPIKNDRGYTLLDCKLFTGRTHQIRVHMEYVQHPVVGDTVYTKSGVRTPEGNLFLSRQFLHSYKIALTHPVTGEELMFSESPEPGLLQALKRLDNRESQITPAGQETETLCRL